MRGRNPSAHEPRGEARNPREIIKKRIGQVTTCQTWPFLFLVSAFLAVCLAPAWLRPTAGLSLRFPVLAAE